MTASCGSADIIAANTALDSVYARQGGTPADTDHLTGGPHGLFITLSTLK
jgi:hypothetical protein